MTRTPPTRWRVPVLGASVAALGLAAAFLVLDRSSTERGNRLYREGRVELAAEIYRARSAMPARAGGSREYNLGTALMTLRAPGAEAHLREATEGRDPAAVQRGHYNLGALFLGQAEAVAQDSAVALLEAAVGSNRAALRLDPHDGSARWNLAYAQLMLDSLLRTAGRDPEPPGEEPPAEQGGLVIRQVAQPGARRGREREATAGVEAAPMSEAEALTLVRTVEPDAEALVRGLLWSRRPAIRPWAEPYPGGDW